MKVSVDSTKCIRCGACVSIAEDNFTFGEDGSSVVKSDVVTDATRRAKDACPVYAISIDETNEETSDKVVNMEEHKCEHCDDCQCEKEAA